LYLSSKNHTKEVYEAMTLRGYGMNAKHKVPFHWKKEDVLLLLELIVLVVVTTMLR
jgi:cobalt ABC superfamily ATP binding cassette transporter permease protein